MIYTKYFAHLHFYLHLCFSQVMPNDHEFELITERLASLMEEGRGECIFEVGLGTDPPSNDEDMDGNPSAEDAEAASGLNQADYEASVATLKSVSDSLDADCVLLRERVLSGGSNTDTQISPEAKRTGQYLIRKRADSKVNFSVFMYPTTAIHLACLILTLFLLLSVSSL